MTSPTSRLAAALAALALGATAALAQTATPPRDPNMPDQRNTVPEQVAPPTSGARPGETLSDRLERTEGVIAPRGNTDPDIRVTPPVPNPGTTPVIRPPGEPGGNQSVQPK